MINFMYIYHTSEENKPRFKQQESTFIVLLLYGKVNLSVLIGSFLVRISPYGPFPLEGSSALYFLVY